MTGDFIQVKITIVFALPIQKSNWKQVLGVWGFLKAVSIFVCNVDRNSR